MLKQFAANSNQRKLIVKPKLVNKCMKLTYFNMTNKTPVISYSRQCVFSATDTFQKDIFNVIITVVYTGNALMLKPTDKDHHYQMDSP